MPFARVNIADCSKQIFAHHALQNVAASTGLHCTINFLFASVSRKHQDARIRELSQNCCCGLGAAHAGEPDIHDHEVGVVSAVGVHRSFAVANLGDHFHVELGVQGGRQPHPHHEMVINDENTNRLCCV